MNTVRWMLSFYHPEGNWKEETNFPEVDFWQRDKQTCQREGARVLQELKELGDAREWVAVGHPDPLEVAAGQHPGGQWIFPEPRPMLFDPDKMPTLDVSEEEWEAFDRAIKESRSKPERDLP